MAGVWRVGWRRPYLVEMRRPGAQLTDEDLARLVRLGGAVDQIAEAAGLDVTEVRSRLPHAANPRELEGTRLARAGDALCG